MAKQQESCMPGQIGLAGQFQVLHYNMVKAETAVWCCILLYSACHSLQSRTSGWTECFVSVLL